MHSMSDFLEIDLAIFIVLQAVEEEHEAGVGFDGSRRKTSSRSHIRDEEDEEYERSFVSSFYLSL